MLAVKIAPPSQFNLISLIPFAPFLVLLREGLRLESDEASTGKATTADLNVKDLALTKDATNVEYNTVVEHVVFKSKSNVKKACAELAASLKAQGWTNDGSDLVQPQSSILKRKRGDATLTIFVKPEGGGSEIKIFTEGLSWDG